MKRSREKQHFFGLVSYPCKFHWVLGIASTQQGDPRLSGPQLSLDAESGARAPDRGIPADLRTDLLATLPPTPSNIIGEFAYPLNKAHHSI
ncbi:hypothetical protein PoB_006839500 [Plakobranchus ocellatus]|uniref:Uncharacterized protein n=1 Tax=Plakobranchus ocellatus TaxID=259542 RepID=A0AAV4DCS7_9GAST|nr:hypothetical protein PoB_006839500 [Plakobranchus ocellatus]